MDFGLVQNKLRGLLRDKTVIEHLHHICQFMEQCLIDWQKYINSQRETHYHLNHFTTTQLVVLRNEIAKLCAAGDEDPSKFIYPMLECVRRNCSPYNIKEALTAMFEELKRREQEASKPETQMEEEMEEDTVKDEQQQENKGMSEEKFLESLKEEGFGLRLSKEAAKLFKPDDLDACKWPSIIV